MLHPSTKRLIDKLSEMTRKNRVSWTEGENASVVHDTEGYRVVLTCEPHAVLLKDGQGREIETCSPEEFAEELDAQGRPYSRFVAELYREAQRHALGTERAISLLLAGLDAVGQEPEPAAADFNDAPDATTDDTALIESETAITAAVATLADQINGAAPAATAEVVEAAPPAPDSAIDAAPFEGSPAPEILPEPEPEPVAELVTEPEPQSEPEPAPEPAPSPEPEMSLQPEPEAPATAEAAAPIEEDDSAADLSPAPADEAEPQAEAPGSFGTFSAFEPLPGEPATPDPAEPVAEVLPELPAEPEAAEPIFIETGFTEPAVTETVLADASAAPAEDPAPAAEPELYAASEPAAPILELAPDAPPEPAPERTPEREPMLATPTLSQPISLSSIPFGFGLGAAQRSGAPSHPATGPESPEPRLSDAPGPRLVIDGTADLPEEGYAAYEDAAAAEPYPPAPPEVELDALPGESVSPPQEPGQPRRFNPWN